jgi:hypothetical protein
MPRPVSNKGSSIIPDGDKLAPIRLTCPPTAKAFSDFAIVPGPPISTTQSTPRPANTAGGRLTHLLAGTQPNEHVSVVLSGNRARRGVTPTEVTWSVSASASRLLSDILYS